MPDNANRRRFIAGAVCPRCALMDKIVVNLDTDLRECVACGFSEARPAAGRAAVATDTGRLREVSTRVSRPAARRVETPAQAITVIDPRGDGEH
jgi:uncharacterized metal-binding protein (TIGR02443 family)